ncbi:hypothetical protein BC629DRAFT_1505181 [Irpex lacteus]|nr:hypothetical protein BC629DRAFT_1505181 [Irpex lacteus]
MSFENGENIADEDFAVLYTGDDTIAKAAHDIQSMSSLTSSVVEDDLVSSLLSRAPDNPELILQAVCQVALQRRRVSLWTSAIDKCCQDGVALLSAQQVIEAIRCFGFESIQQELDLSLDRDLHNAPKWELLHGILELVDNLPDDDAERGRTRGWAASRLSQVPHSLRVPIRGEELVLVDIAKASGGLDFLQDPKTQETLLLADDGFLRDFASTIHTSFPDSPTRSTSSHLFSLSQSQKRPLPGTSDGPAIKHELEIASVVDDPRLARAKAYLQTAQDLECGHLLVSIIDRVLDADTLATDQRENHARLVLLPLVVFISQHTRMAVLDTDGLMRLSELQRRGINLFLSFLRVELNQVYVTQREVACFLDAAVAIMSSSTRSKYGPHPNKQFLDRVDLKNRFNIFCTLNLCATAGSLDLCSDVITKCLNDPATTTPEYIDDVLVPLLPELRSWAEQHGRNMDIEVRAIVVAWLGRVLGPRPVPDPVCQACVNARTFLIKGEQDSATLNCNRVRTRRHVEGFLDWYAQQLASWTTDSVSPQCLKITRSTVLAKFIRWRRNQIKGITFLQGLAVNEYGLKKILGSAYDRVRLALVPQPSGAPTADPPSHHPGPVDVEVASSNRRTRTFSETFAEPPAKKPKDSTTAT